MAKPTSPHHPEDRVEPKVIPPPPTEPTPAHLRAQHAACTNPFPEKLPGVPRINSTATGRPRFDEWRDIPCDRAKTPLCTRAVPEKGCGLCLSGTPQTQGLCTESDIDGMCDGEGEVIGYNDGRCAICASLELHARACCKKLPGFDCRAWPYPADGKPGMVCARHEDCESGLVCGPIGDHATGYGICQCPGVSLSGNAACSYPWRR